MHRDTPLVLAVDDEPDITMLCQVNLELDGLDAIVAADGRRAVEMLRSREPDALLLDLWMQPPFDGWYVLDQLEHIASDRNLPVIVLTAQVSNEVEARAWERGVAGFVRKPFVPASLAPLVRAVIAEPPEHRAARCVTERARVQVDHHRRD